MMDPPESAPPIAISAPGMMSEEPPVFRSLSGVVRVFVSYVESDPIDAQDMGVSSDNRTVNGVAISTTNGPRILTTASAMIDNAFIQVKRHDSDELFVAEIFFRCIDCDLSLITVKDQRFWASLALVPIAEIPSLRSEVLIAGYTDEGTELEVTSGVVSRIESQTFILSMQTLPAITVDASTKKAGNCPPVFNKDGQLIGLRFQTLASSDNVGLVSPPRVIKNLLEGIATFGVKQYRGFPSAGIKVQQMTNPYLREQLKIGPEVTGVLVAENRFGHTCHGVLQERDIITHIGDADVSNNGTVPFGSHGRIHLGAAFSLYQCDDTIDLRIIRDGKPRTVQVVAKPCACLIQTVADPNEKAYVTWAGLVFRKVTTEYLQVSGGSAYLWEMNFWGQRSDQRDEIIVLSQVLSDTANAGYESFIGEQIISVNGHEIKNLDDLLSRINKSLTKLVRFETREGNLMVVPSPADPAAKGMMDQIDRNYGGGPPQVAPEAARCCVVL